MMDIDRKCYFIYQFKYLGRLMGQLRIGRRRMQATCYCLLYIIYIYHVVTGPDTSPQHW